ncbi:DinB family protein [Umezawaea endophytica]|uniref:DinB family protein n=1 Tax=Umezawaea endophytica TaxID=1654476 RepID=A0A9X2VK83_9PSEU|nr:DinB family protein [Umezawaea endophytica]MCS7478160.1 DinB family protein [Umezawaea endophytica]
MSSNLPERRWPETYATDELRLQWEFLDFLRLTATSKVAGLSRALGAAAPLATSPVVTAMGVLKHLTAVERYWMSIVGGGADLPSLWGVDADASWVFRDDETPETVISDYQAEWVLSARALEGRGPDEPTALPDDKTVRWVLVHVIQETARHVGHLDFLRELADGTKGE